MLLDECVPKRLRQELSPHNVRTVPEMGWASKKNGALLRLAAGHWDVFVTTDQRLSYQQVVSNGSRRQLAAKARGYLAAGARLVWVVWPERQCVEVFRPSSPPQLLGAADTLDGKQLLPAGGRGLSGLRAEKPPPAQRGWAQRGHATETETRPEA